LKTFSYVEQLEKSQLYIKPNQLTKGRLSLTPVKGKNRQKKKAQMYSSLFQLDLIFHIEYDIFSSD